MQAINPPGIRAPFAQYSHALHLQGASQLLVMSGQLGVRADDTVPGCAQAQAECALGNIDAILAAAGLDRGAVVKLNAYVTDRSHMAGYMTARDAWVARLTPPPASTLMIVSGFTRPELVVEIEAFAAC